MSGLSSGVSQGNVLRPTLFTLYINGLLNKINSTSKGAAIAYADDVTIVGSGNTPREAAALIQQIILNVCDYSAINGLILYPSKCQAMFIHPFKRKTDTADTSGLALGDTGNCIQLVTELRLLGVTFSVHLSWSVQSSKVRTSISRMIGVMNRFGTSVNCNTRRRVLTAFAFSTLTYCLSVWSAINKTNVKAMDRMLLQAACVVLHSKTAELNQDLYKATNILPLDLLSSFKCLLTTHALLQDNVSVYQPQMLSNPNCQRSTRGNEGRKFLLPTHTISGDKLCFYYSASKIRNDALYKLTQEQSISQFYNQALLYIFSKFSA